MKLYCYLIGFTLLIPTLSSAQSADEILFNVQEKFRTITDFTADFKQTIIPSNSTKGVSSAGKFGYARGNKFYLNLTDSDILSDGVTIWNYNKKLKRVVINNIADDPGTFSLEKYILDYPAFCSSELAKDKISEENILILKPEKGNLGFSEARLWTAENNIVTKFEITDPGQNKFLIELRNIQINVSVNQAKFKFDSPEGIQVIDLR